MTYAYFSTCIQVLLMLALMVGSVTASVMWLSCADIEDLIGNIIKVILQQFKHTSKT